MNKFRFNSQKQEILNSLNEKRSNVDLEEVAFLLSSGNMIDSINIPNYPEQVGFVLPYKGDLLLVPCRFNKEGNYWLIATAWYSRKLRKEFPDEFEKEKLRYFGKEGSYE